MRRLGVSVLSIAAAGDFVAVALLVLVAACCGRAEAAAVEKVADPAGTECACDCPEFFSPKRNSCLSRCVNYSQITAACVIERERKHGRSEAAIEQELKSCSTDCPVLRKETRTICKEALFGIAKACEQGGANGITPRQVECYLDYLVRDLDEPLKSQFRQKNADQLAAATQEVRDMMIGGILAGLQTEQGTSCPP